MPNQPHHNTRRYRQTAATIRHLANTNPNTRCCRDAHGNPCGLTLTQHPPGATWTAGHTIDGSHTWQPWLHPEHIPPPGDWLAPQASTCNYAAAANTTNRQRTDPHTEQW